jgi:hypothetical protein
MRKKLLPELRIGFESIGDLCGLAEVGCIGARLNERHLIPNAFTSAASGCSSSITSRRSTSLRLLSIVSWEDLPDSMKVHAA